jgi:hypothetical protein
MGHGYNWLRRDRFDTHILCLNVPQRFPRTIQYPVPLFPSAEWGKPLLFFLTLDNVRALPITGGVAGRAGAWGMAKACLSRGFFDFRTSSR